MPSEQAKDPGGLETRTVNLQAPGFSLPSTAEVLGSDSQRGDAPDPGIRCSLHLSQRMNDAQRHQMSPRGRTA